MLLIKRSYIVHYNDAEIKHYEKIRFYPVSAFGGIDLLRQGEGIQGHDGLCDVADGLCLVR